MSSTFYFFCFKFLLVGSLFSFFLLAGESKENFSAKDFLEKVELDKLVGRILDNEISKKTLILKKNNG